VLSDGVPVATASIGGFSEASIDVFPGAIDNSDSSVSRLTILGIAIFHEHMRFFHYQISRCR
jgi:hypothetical protein